MPIDFAANACFLNSHQTVRGGLKPHSNHKPTSPCVLQRQEAAPCIRRHVLLHASASLVSTQAFGGAFDPLRAWAAKDKKIAEDEEGQGVVGALKSLFDPDEKTKSGKVLPKAYFKSARGVVKTLRESLKEDTRDIAKFRRTADAAKESIRDYLSNWRGQQKVAGEESYAELEKAIRSLATFYSKAGPSAPIPEKVKSEILDNLNRAEKYL